MQVVQVKYGVVVLAVCCVIIDQSLVVGWEIVVDRGGCRYL